MSGECCRSRPGLHAGVGCPVPGGRIHGVSGCPARSFLGNARPGGQAGLHTLVPGRLHCGKRIKMGDWGMWHPGRCPRCLVWPCRARPEGGGLEVSVTDRRALVRSSCREGVGLYTGRHVLKFGGAQRPDSARVPVDLARRGQVVILKPACCACRDGSELRETISKLSLATLCCRQRIPRISRITIKGSSIRQRRFCSISFSSAPSGTHEGQLDTLARLTIGISPGVQLT